MKQLFKDHLLKGVKKLAYKEAEKNVNSACVWYHYQPELPKGAEKLRKFNDQNVIGNAE